MPMLKEEVEEEVKIEDKEAVVNKEEVAVKIVTKAVVTKA
jgi:hypothetical protein